MKNRECLYADMPEVIKSDKCVFVDVDETLVIWSGDLYTPHKKHIEMIKRFHERNQPVIVWSAGGWEWAERVVNELGISKYVTLIISKPAWYMDDRKAEEILPEANRIYFDDK